MVDRRAKGRQDREGSKRADAGESWEIRIDHGTSGDHQSRVSGGFQKNRAMRK